MERLTEFHNGIWGMSVQSVKNGYDRYSVFSKLAEYEDTGLTPEEVKNLRNKYGTLLEMYDKQQNDRDYWEREAKKYCAEIGEIRILEGQELCNK